MGDEVIKLTGLNKEEVVTLQKAVLSFLILMIRIKLQDTSPLG